VSEGILMSVKAEASSKIDIFKWILVVVIFPA